MKAPQFQKSALHMAKCAWYNSGYSCSSINKTDHENIADILLKVVLNTNIHHNNHFECSVSYLDDCPLCINIDPLKLQKDGALNLC